MVNTIYRYNKDTGEYISSGTCRNDPRGGQPMVPANATLIQPPAVGINEVAVYAELDETWSAQPDYRGEIWYQPDGTTVEFTAIGEIPSANLSKTIPVDIQLATAKNIKINELRLACRAEIYAGFDSSALGSVHHYPLSQTDQANMQAAHSMALANETTSGWSVLIQAIPTGDTVSSYFPHTAAQVKQTADDIMAGKERVLTKLAALISSVQSSTDEVTVNGIIW